MMLNTDNQNKTIDFQITKRTKVTKDIRYFSTFWLFILSLNFLTVRIVIDIKKLQEPF